MPKKPTRKMLAKRFLESDIERWQKEANKTHRANLTWWMEETLNKSLNKQHICQTPSQD